MQALHVGQLLTSCQSWVAAAISPEASQPRPADLSRLLAIAGPATPPVIVKAAGTNALSAIQQQAAIQGASVKSLSLGNNAALLAEPTLTQCLVTGEWLCLQNCHLAPAWMPRCALPCSSWSHLCSSACSNPPCSLHLIPMLCVWQLGGR